MVNKHNDSTDDIENTFKIIKTKLKDNPINIEKCINLNSTERKFSTTFYSRKIVLISVCIILALSIIAWKKVRSFNEGFSINYGLDSLAKQGKVQSTKVFSEDEGIKVYIEGIIPDSQKTIIQIRIEGLKENDKKYNNDTAIPELSPGDVKLIDEKNRCYTLVSYGAGSSDVPNVTRLEYKALPDNIQNLTLSFNRIGGVQGKWNLNFPVKMFELQEWNPNIKTTNEGTEINITKVSFSGSQIKINGVFICDNEKAEKLLTSSYIILNGKKIQRNDGMFSSTNSNSIQHDFEITFPAAEIDSNLKLVFEISDKNIWEIKIPCKE